MTFKIEPKDTYTKEEQRANAEIWAQALESGEFGQTKRVLKNKAGRYCCMGVLEHITGGAFGKDEFGECFAERNKQTDYPSVIAYEAVGLRRSIRTEDGGCSDLDGHLAGLNDDFGKRFKTIAKTIRKYLVKEPDGD